MRDLRKFRNKLTIELDNRQIAFLFTGVLAVLAIVFALGVVVGKGLGQMQGPKATTAMNVTPAPGPDVPPPAPLEADAALPEENPTDKAAAAPGPVNLLDEATPAAPEATPVPTPEPTPEPVKEPEIPKLPKASSVPTPPQGGGWTVQLSAHQNESEAAARQQKWLSKGIKAFVVKTDLGSKGVWYRVRVGKFATKAGAQEFASAIGEKENIKPFVAPLN